MIMKFIYVLFFLNISFAFSQELVEKQTIGKYEYSFFLKKSFNVENNIDIISYYVRLRDKEQWLGTALTYRKKDSSKNYKKKIDENHPPDPRSILKDGIILSEGVMEINEIDKKIIIKEYFFEDQMDPSNTERIYIQKKDGFFELLK